MIAAAKAKTAVEPFIARKDVRFQSEGRLLQELGERLVASPQVAIVELIKNAYDADSPICELRYDESSKTITIRDEGTGISAQDFEGKWMRIASDSKSRTRESPVYRRKMTGEKGIGRFAVRYLGQFLTLESVAHDKKRGFKTRLVAAFDWVEIDKKADLSKVKISYTLHRVGKNVPTGTNLIISQLRDNDLGPEVFGRKVRNEILQIVTPVSGIDSGRFRRLDYRAGNDPGFRVILPKAPDGEEGEDDVENLAAKVLENYWARLTIDLTGKRLRIRVDFPSSKSATKLIEREDFENSIASGLYADIRYFPKRGGIFTGKSFDGRLAWNWIRSNSGVGIVDHGLRIRPYGFDQDDWLVQDQDSASNRRDWRSNLMLEDYPIPPEIKKVERRNPMLSLPQARQLVGAVFVESNSKQTGQRGDGLIPSMDREGFLRNPAFNTLWDIIRAGIELLAYADRENEERILRDEAAVIAQEAKKDFRAAIEYVRSSATLTEEDKARFIKQYEGLARHFDEAETYGRKVIAGVETMSLIGVVAGFMTHESARIVSALERLLHELGPLKELLPQLTDVIDTIRESHDEFARHLDYTSSFIDAIQDGLHISTFPVKPQLEVITEKFGRFARSRKIKITIEVDDSVESPPISIAVYSGIVLNLYTNAIKAVVAGQNHMPEIVFRAWNDHVFHNLEVIDNGIGIPERLRERVWDPLFTTTSRDNNPLGSGMGLGLSLVRKLVNDMGGRISIEDAPPAYSTCFRLQLKLRPKYPYDE
jgi:signal transduction histidine kinase